MTNYLLTMLITPLFLHNYQITTLINLLCFLDCIRDFESCMWSIMQSGRQPGKEAISTHIICSESKDAAA